MSNKFIILLGPSCIGKSQLMRALKTFYPALGNPFRQLVLYNDRPIRPGEQEGVDYFFRPRGEIEALGHSPGHVMAEVRGDLQVLELAQIQRILDDGNFPFFEGNPYIPEKLRDVGALDQLPALSVFLSPVSREEILFLKSQSSVDLETVVTEIQRRKLLYRAGKMKTALEPKELANMEQRCASTIHEMRNAWKLDYVIPMHDGECNDNWDVLGFPIGATRRALEAFAALLQGNETPDAEKWEENLVS
jgi:guanylate kinase